MGAIMGHREQQLRSAILPHNRVYCARVWNPWRPDTEVRIHNCAISLSICKWVSRTTSAWSILKNILSHQWVVLLNLENQLGKGAQLDIFHFKFYQFFPCGIWITTIYHFNLSSSLSSYCFVKMSPSWARTDCCNLPFIIIIIIIGWINLQQVRLLKHMLLNLKGESPLPLETNQNTICNGTHFVRVFFFFNFHEC